MQSCLLEQLSNYGNIIQEIIAGIFETYIIVDEIPLSLDKIGKIHVIRKEIHNYMIT